MGRGILNADVSAGKELLSHWNYYSGNHMSGDLNNQVKAEYWQPHECFTDFDANYNPVDVCMDGYNIGIFWNDGSYVNGYRTSRSDYNVDYYGLSKRDAISWVDYYC